MELQLEELKPVARELVAVALGITHASATAVLAERPEVFEVAVEALHEVRALLRSSAEPEL